MNSICQSHLLVKQQTILTSLQAHPALLTFVKLVTGHRICIDLNPIKNWTRICFTSIWSQFSHSF